jgi:hypothetical protein
MSAFLPLATTERKSLEVRFVPKAANRLLPHFVARRAGPSHPKDVSVCAKAGSKGIVRSSGQLSPSQPAASKPLIAGEPAMRLSARENHGDATRSGRAGHHVLLAVPDLACSADIKLI